jgi:hypothetical protein
MFRTNVCPKHIEQILKINKYCCLLHLVGLDFIALPKKEKSMETGNSTKLWQSKRMALT